MDALRGVAVVGVLLYHHDRDLLPGGFLGVSLFFTLSGFLITTLLVGEHADTGGVAVGRFWARRLRRLAPVALCGLVLAVALAGVTHPDARMAEIAGDVRAAALHVANWRFAAADVGYGDAFAVPSPVAHYWSLAIEEQFYAVYPLVALLALRRGRGALAAVLGVVVVIAAARAVAVDANRAYLGTDTRALELAVGGLAALARTRWRDLGRGRALDALAVAAGAALLASWATVELGDERLWRGGIAAHAVLAAVVVLGAVDGRAVAALGRARPLVALGALSYSAYVVHFPLFLALDEARTGLDGVALLVVRVAVTLAVAAAVHVLVEQPVRLGGALPRWQAPVALASGAAVAVLIATALPHLAAGRASATTVAAGGATLVTMPAIAAPPTTAAPTTAAPAAAVATPDPPAAPAAVTPPTPASPEPPPPAPPPPAAVAAPRRLLVVGDSSAEFIGAGLQQWAAATGAQVDLVYEYACTFLHDGEYLIREGWVYRQTAACAGLVDSAVAVARERAVDAILVFAGNFQVASWRADPALPFAAVGDPAVDAPVLAALTDVVGRLASVGVPVLVADLPVPAWDADTPTPTGSLPGSGPPTINDPVRVAALNALTARAVATQPRARLLPWAALLAGPDGTIEASDRVDGLHVDPDVARARMDGPLGAAVVALHADAASVPG